MAIPAIIAGGITAGKLLDKSGVLGAAKNLLGIGQKRYTDCGEKQAAARQAFDAYFTSADLQTIANWHTHGALTGRTSNALAFHYAGGDDCKTTSSGGKEWVSRVNTLLQKRVSEAEQAERNAATARADNTETRLLSIGSTGNAARPALLISGLGITGLIIAYFMLRK